MQKLCRKRIPNPFNKLLTEKGLLFFLFTYNFAIFDQRRSTHYHKNDELFRIISQLSGNTTQLIHNHRPLHMTFATFSYLPCRVLPPHAYIKDITIL